MEIISVIGPIGSGKSSFVEHTKKFNIADDYYHENVEGNIWLKMEPTIDNLVSCQAFIINQKKEFYQKYDSQSDIKILEDASLYQDLYYVDQSFKEHSPMVHRLVTDAYLTLIKSTYDQSVKHKIIFMELDPHQNLKNVKSRGRDFEQQLDLDFFVQQREKLKKILSKFSNNFEFIEYRPNPEKYFIEKEEEEKEYYKNIFTELGLI